MKIIGFTGLAGAGKTSAALSLVQHVNVQLSGNAKRIAFADPLKELCASTFPWLPRTTFYGAKEEKEAEIPEMPGWSGRRILQHIGTEGFRAIDAEMWVRLTEHRLMVAPRTMSLIAIDDVRYPNEAAMVRRHGLLFRIVRPNNPGAVGDAADHESERYASALEVDAEIANDGPLEKLYETVRVLYRDI